MARGRSIFGCDYILRCDLKHKSPSRRISANSSAITASASHPEPDPRLPPPPLSGVRLRRPPLPPHPCVHSLASSPRTRRGSARSPRPRARASSGRVPPRGDGVRVLFDFRFKNYSRRQCHSDQSFSQCALSTETVSGDRVPATAYCNRTKSHPSPLSTHFVMCRLLDFCTVYPITYTSEQITSIWILRL